MKARWIVLMLFMSLSFISKAEEEIKGIVTRVIDGNTIEVTAFNQEVYSMMLLGIDSPESGQPYAENARRLLTKLLQGQTVKIVVHGKDRLGNRLGVIEMPDGIDPRHELLKAGLAWTSEKSPLPDLEALREEARNNNRGLWGSPDPTPPWTFRRQQSMQGPKSSG